jgi:hypothetical protein
MFRVLTTDANEGVTALRMVTHGQKNRPKEE